MEQISNEEIIKKRAQCLQIYYIWKKYSFMKKKLSELKLGEVFKFEDKPDLYHFAGKKDDLYHYYHNITLIKNSSEDLIVIKN